MGRILSLVLGLAVISGIAYYVLNHHTPVAGIDDSPNAPSAPKQQLDNVRRKAKSIEDEQQHQVDETDRKTREAEGN